MSVEPASAGFPGARSFIWERRRDLLKDHPKWEDRYFVSDKDPDTVSKQWFYRKIRDHWGIESRLHWRKDAILLEDKTRCRHRQVVTNLMLLRNLAIHFYEHTRGPNERMPAWVNQNQRDPRTLCRRILRTQWSK